RRSWHTVLPMHERPVPQNAVTPDHTASSQPFSALTLSPPRVKQRDMWGMTVFDQLACRIIFRSLRYDGMFTPPSLRGSIVYPGNFGVIDWGGLAVDPRHQIAFANPSYFAFYSRLVPRAPNE